MRRRSPALLAALILPACAVAALHGAVPSTTVPARPASSDSRPSPMLPPGDRASPPLPAMPAIVLPVPVPRVTERVRRPQEPARPLPYREYDVVIPVSSAAGPGVRLAGTLSVPPTPGPHPAVVLVAGTGPQDRDASVAGHRPFLVLADHLVRSGIAVLRYDERGVGHSTGHHATATTLDFAADAAAAVNWLAAHRATDAARIGVIGHSEGGMVAPLVSASTPRVAFVVLLAAPGVRLTEIGVRQAEAMARAEGATPREIAARVRLASAVMALFGEDLQPEILQARARPALEQGLAALPPALRAREVERALEYYASPWARFAFRHDPAAALRSLRVPVLALNGTRDTQIDAATNLRAIEAALRDGGNPSVHVQALPGLNHYFQTARSGALTEYARIDETFAPAALSLISRWVVTASSR